MIFSHISDTHLGLQQYGLEEREQDIYDSFNQAIDISIKDKVDFVIFAGDIFHTPNPNGKAILQMANALKKLKQNSIESFFIQENMTLVGFEQRQYLMCIITWNFQDILVEGSLLITKMS